MATKINIPATSSIVSVEEVTAMIGEYESLADGQAASDGNTYDSRSKANNVASTYLRLMRARGVEARSRTFEIEPGQWVFGILHPTTPPQPGDSDADSQESSPKEKAK